MSYILGAGTNSRLYQSLVVDQTDCRNLRWQLIIRAGGLDDTRFLSSMAPRPTGKGIQSTRCLMRIKAEIAKFIA